MHFAGETWGQNSNYRKGKVKMVFIPYNNTLEEERAATYVSP
jgi:hypothetical protein